MNGSLFIWPLIIQHLLLNWISSNRLPWANASNSDFIIEIKWIWSGVDLSPRLLVIPCLRDICIYGNVVVLVAHSVCRNLAKMLNLDRRHVENGLYIAFCHYSESQFFLSASKYGIFVLSTVELRCHHYLQSCSNISTGDKSSTIFAVKFDYIWRRSKYLLWP